MANILDFGGFGNKIYVPQASFVKNTSDYCNSRELLILSWHRKAWLHSKGFNMGNNYE